MNSYINFFGLASNKFNQFISKSKFCSLLKISGSVILYNKFISSSDSNVIYFVFDEIFIKDLSKGINSLLFISSKDWTNLILY